ncbi:putative ump-cmp kinase protein [Botrytis fragariae]|uniref:Putative ump-cmp kinase protein n=1 Tax=Botrytis fragariae TaxID=1964551 RepID=A0A8H6AZG1_9HELO|nr:putative ump-cmp kinase protein [Botrytis fragariae]KAF5876305.1 putative ump-cmp kinase protein [Botrytis fragariae]
MDEQYNRVNVLPRSDTFLIYVIGCPGSGKGTLCKLLAQYYRCHHISVGDLLRDLQNEQSLAIKDYIQEGELLRKPDLVLYFCCGKEIALHRYLTRKLEGRLDDNEEIFHRRYEEFERLNPAIVDYYRDLGILLVVCSESFERRENADSILD